MWESKQKARKALILILLISLQEINGAPGKPPDIKSKISKRNEPKVQEKPYELTKATTKTQFQKVGKMSAQAATGHVLFSFPVNETYASNARIKDLCYLLEEIKSNNTLDKWNRGSLSFKRMEVECEVALQETADLEKNINILFHEKMNDFGLGTSQSREKRFIGTVAIMALGGLGLYSISQLWQMKNDFESDRERKKIFTIVKDNFLKTTTNEKKVQVLNDTLQELINATGSIVREIDMMRQLGLIRRQLNTEMRQLREINTAVMNLVNGVITPLIIPTDLMLKAKDELTSKARDKDYVIPFTHLMEYYQLPHNILIQRDVITIFLHVPLVSKKGLLDLYSMVPTVMKLNDRINGLIYEKNLLGVSEDSTSFRVTNREKLDQCILMGMQYYYCPTTLLYRNFDAFCISSVYKGHWQEANRICEMKILPETTWADQISEKEFFIYHNKSEMVEVNCEGEKFTEQLQGAYYFETEGQTCKVTSDYYEFQTMPKAEVKLTRVNRPTAWEKPKLLKNIKPEFVEGMLEKLHSVEPTNVEEFYRNYRISNNEDPEWLKWSRAIPGYISFAVHIAIMLAICCLTKIRKRRQKRELDRVAVVYSNREERLERPIIKREEKRARKE